jgi:hypothetical protein
MIYASAPTRKHDAILKIIEMNLKEETGSGALANSHVSPRRSMAGRRAASSTALVSPDKQAAPNRHASLRRSMAGRRAASSKALGGSKRRHPLFPRQFSLRGWRENDSGHVGISEEISEEKQTRLHDYTKSPIGVCESPLEQYD